MSNDDYSPVNMDVLFELGLGKPDAPQVGYDSTPESWAMVLQTRRRYYAQCLAMDGAFAAQRPGLTFRRLCDRPEIKRLLEDLSAPSFEAINSPA
jgi:hypothetical protein